jgi:dihydroorotase
MNMGAMATSLGYKGIPGAAEEQMLERDIALARETGGSLHICHASTAKSLDLIHQAKKQGVHITSEVTPHHLALTEEAVLSCGTNAKVNPPLRTKYDTEALLNGLNEGIIDAVATDHAPHSVVDKDKAFDQAAFGISGFETALGSLITLVSEGKLPLLTLLSKLTTEPARIINGTEYMGALRLGSPADVTVFDPQFEWMVDPQKFFSKGKNTPLTGTKLKGKVIATVVSGNIVFRY